MANTVERALDTVRQLSNRPKALVDNHALLAALEQLADVSRDLNHADRKKYSAIYKQCRSLVLDQRLATVVTCLLGDEDEKVVATQIQKLLKAEAPLYSPYGFGNRPIHSGVGRQPYYINGASYRPPVWGVGMRNRRGAGRQPERNRCFHCHQAGHFIANCPNRN